MGDHRPATWEGGGKKSVRAQTVGQPAPAEPEPQVAEATDAAKALAAQHNIDLAFVPGTGAGGQITKGDVQAVLPEPEPVPEPIPDEAEIPPEEPAAEAEPPIEEPVAEAEVPAEQA